MKILITGGSGFFGSALARRLADAGHAVALLLRPGSSLRRLEHTAARCTVGRCSSDAELADFVAATAPEAVVHTACSYGRQGESLLQLLDANLRFGAALLQAVAALPGHRRVSFLHTGSCLAPAVSDYALSKHQFAQWGRAQAVRHPERLQFIQLRLQHLYGPGDERTRFVSHVLHSCHAQQPTLALTAGEQRRDFIYIDDAVSACQLLLARAHEMAAHEEVDVGSGTAPTLRCLVQTAHLLTSSRTRLDFGALPYRPHEAMLCRADTTRLRGLGWAPAYDLPAGQQKTIELEFP